MEAVRGNFERIIRILKKVIFAITLTMALMLSGSIKNAWPAMVWDQVNRDGFGTTNNVGANSMVEYNGCLYVGTENNDPLSGAQIWRYDGTDWTQVATAYLNFVEDSNNTIASSMCVYNGKLYVGTRNNSTGAEVWEYDGTSWTQVNTDGFGDYHNSCASSMIQDGTYLYVGTENYSTGAEVWRYDGSSWTRIGSGGVGDSNNIKIGCMEIDGGGQLWAGTANNSGCQVWRYAAGTWTEEISDGFGDSNNSSADSIILLYDYIYVGTENSSTGAEIW